MANKEHLAQLKPGVGAWNKWRITNPQIQPDLEKADLIRKNLPGVNLAKVVLTRALLTGAHLQGANLQGAHLTGAYLQGANLQGADLTQAVFDRTVLTEADLTEACLIRAALFGADLTRANLTKVDLTRANLIKVNLSRVSLTRVNLDGATMGWTILGNDDLSTVRGLDTVEHKAPSTIGIDTLYHSQGNIPDVFLRGAGVPDDVITHIKSLVGRPFEFYSCFISYSSKDQKFVERLYADLQSNGVRCWFAPEDLKIGEKFRMRIDEAIRLRDKLLLVLSTHSITSEWVETEVEAALEEEHRRKKTILFPIQLDDSVMETHQAWAANIRRTRHLGNFRMWKDHDSYRRAFERLLRDLKADMTHEQS